MATNAIPVTADQKDEPGVQAVMVNVPGVGEVETYIKVETTDDLDGKTTKDVKTYSFSMPVEGEREVVELDAEGGPVFNDDGTKALKIETFWEEKAFEVDLSPASLKKFSRALEPFIKNARELVILAPVVPAPSKPKAAEGPDAGTVRRWAQANDIRVNGEPINSMGRVPQEFKDAYLKAHA
ncbi:histone-like nucleoid-structuring protein Lsr2 [Streptomyces sp. NPDC058369]|uniref:Lsr2 dimerization domain-containing protein n=1 Tax=Streptomyces sp. NPDC058369 TaxID=3346462 RepID=UPI00365BAA92